MYLMCISFTHPPMLLCRLLYSNSFVGRIPDSFGLLTVLQTM